MNIHEFQAKQVLGRFGVPVPKGSRPRRRTKRQRPSNALGQPKAVVKAQIHAGGRGKAGGVKFVTQRGRGPRIRRKAARQTAGDPSDRAAGPRRAPDLHRAGERSRARAVSGMVVDRKAESVAVIASTEGGMDIEEVAAKTPEKIITEPIDPVIGLGGFQARKIAFALGLKDKQVGQFGALLTALYRAFNETDASLIEINPLVVTKDGSVICLDAKMSFDDNGLFRHPDIRELRDANEEDPAEIEAVEVRPQLCASRRQYRLHGQRRGPRDGDDGHRQILRRRTGELPRRRRWREFAESRGGVPYPAGRRTRQSACWSISSAVSCFVTCSPRAWSTRRVRSS